MSKILAIVLFFCMLQVRSQEVTSIAFSDLQEKMRQTEARLTIFNFWATWCGPCVKEIPYFEALEQENDDVKVYLVSIDFPQDLEKVRAFVRKRKLNVEVFFLDEKDPDRYIRRIDPSWSGAIPATLFINDSKETFFYEKAFTKEELYHMVKIYSN